MKTTILSIIVTLLIFSNQNAIGQKLPDLIPFMEKGLYGYCDSNLNIVIKAQYQRVYPFVGDMAIVEINFLKGFIDRKGNQIVPCVHRYASPFSPEGYAMVGNSEFDAKYINTKGQIVAKPDHIGPPPIITEKVKQDNRFGPIKEGRYFYKANNNTEGYVTVDGDTISSSEYKYPYYSESYSTPDNYDQQFRHFYESRAVVSGGKGQGYIDLNGYLVIDTIYDATFNFKEGRAKVKLNGKYGFIDKQGNRIGEIKYDQACYFYDGMAQVIMGEKCGYINLEGQEVVPLNYDYWQGEQYYVFRNGFVRVRINEKFGILDKNGNAITEIKYDDISTFHNERAIVMLEDKFGLIDGSGKEIISPIYSRLYYLDKFALLFETDPYKRHYGLIDLDGDILVTEGENRPAAAFSAGLYKIMSDEGHLYYFDKYGKKYLK